MRAARFKPVALDTQPERLGPQLVPPRPTVLSRTLTDASEASGSHPMVMMSIAVILAFTGALAVAGSLLTWLLIRNTGVNWMFQR